MRKPPLGKLPPPALSSAWNFMVRGLIAKGIEVRDSTPPGDTVAPRGRGLLRQRRQGRVNGGCDERRLEGDEGNEFAGTKGGSDGRLAHFSFPGASIPSESASTLSCSDA